VSTSAIRFTSTLLYSWTAMREQQMHFMILDSLIIDWDFTKVISKLLHRQ